MDGTTTVGVDGGRRSGSRTALAVPLVLALLLGALSVLVLLPAAQHLRSLRDGERADDPRVVAREEDLGGGAAAVGAVTAGGAALFFLVLPIPAARYRRRSTAPRVDRPWIRA
ncbi:hypothetical protein ACWGCK_16280 [Streptomyces virginiae]